MRYEHVRSCEDGLLYITDCTLATVSYMAMLKSKSKSEHARQISIAQKALDILRRNNVVIDSGNRARTIIDSYNGNVSEWAASLS